MMGLDLSHGDFSMSYSSFGEFRRRIAKAALGIELDDMQGFGGTTLWPDATKEPLVYFLHHSDCEGEITWQHCGEIAKQLQEYHATICAAWPNRPYFVERLDDLRAALEEAHELQEDLEFQ